MKSQNSAIFSFLIKATAPTGTKYIAGRRYELILFVRHTSLGDAKTVARDTISKMDWTFPEVVEAAQVDGNMRLDKLKRLNLEQAIRIAAKNGHSMVIFD